MTTEFKRMYQIIGSEAAWVANDLPLGAGEIAFAIQDADGAIWGKVGDGASKFSELSYTVGQQGIPITGTVVGDPVTGLITHENVNVSLEYDVGITTGVIDGYTIKSKGIGASAANVYVDMNNNLFVFQADGQLTLPDIDYDAAAAKSAVTKEWIEAEIAAGGGGVVSHPDLTNRDAADSHPISAITNLQTTLDAKVTQGYGGITLASNTGISDITVGNWQALPADTGVVTTPVDVTQSVGINAIAINSPGVWVLTATGGLIHNSAVTGRTMGVRLFNLSQVTALREAVIASGRDQTVTSFEYTFLVEVDALDVGDEYQLQVGGLADNYTGVTVDVFSLEAFHVSAGAGSGGGATGGKFLIEEISDPVTGAFRFITIPQTFKTLILELEGRSDEVALKTGIRGYVNGDTADANYFFQNSFGRDGGSSVSSGNIANLGTVPGASAPANSYSRHEITFQNYTSANLKIMSTEFTSYFAGVDGMDTGHIGTIALNVSAAISEIEIRTDNFGVTNLTGTARLYGVP